jgi:CheY-like chemotaxis protein
MPKILFFDDQPNASENRLFRRRLRRTLADFDVQIHQEKIVREFEDTVQKHDFDLIILDVMAKVPGSFAQTGTRKEVPEYRTGVELLRRCRTGYYGDHYRTVPVYMRSARGEMHIQRQCEVEGATHYFRVGRDDKQLIETILEYLKTQEW